MARWIVRRGKQQVLRIIFGLNGRSVGILAVGIEVAEQEFARGNRVAGYAAGAITFDIGLRNAVAKTEMFLAAWKGDAIERLDTAQTVTDKVPAFPLN